MKSVLLREESFTNIKHEDLNLQVLLQVHDENSAKHLVGNINLFVNNNDKTIAEFFIDHDKPENAYLTKIYKNYFLSFKIESNNKYLIIERSKIGKTFALSSKENAIIESDEDLLEIKIKDFLHLSGWNHLPEEEEENSVYFSDVEYTLHVQENDVVKDFTFSSSVLGENYIIELNCYRITIISDFFKDTSALLEMIINKK